MKNRYAFLLVGLMATLNANAETPSIELATVTRAMLNSPEAVEAVRKNGSHRLIDSQITINKTPGVNEIELTFVRSCECQPSTAIIKIIEEENPDEPDSAPTYKSSVTIKP